MNKGTYFDNYITNYKKDLVYAKIPAIKNIANERIRSCVVYDKGKPELVYLNFYTIKFITLQNIISLIARGISKNDSRYIYLHEESRYNRNIILDNKKNTVTIQINNQAGISFTEITLHINIIQKIYNTISHIDVNNRNHVTTLRPNQHIYVKCSYPDESTTRMVPFVYKGCDVSSSIHNLENFIVYTALNKKYNGRIFNVYSNTTSLYLSSIYYMFYNIYSCNHLLQNRSEILLEAKEPYILTNYKNRGFVNIPNQFNKFVENLLYKIQHPAEEPFASNINEYVKRIQTIDISRNQESTSVANSLTNYNSELASDNGFISISQLEKFIKHHVAAENGPYAWNEKGSISDVMNCVTPLDISLT